MPDLNQYPKSLISHPARRVFLSLANFWCTRERICMNRVRSLLSMRCMLLGYSFEPRPNSHVLATADTVMTISLSINRGAHSKKQFDNCQREQDWLVQKFGCGDLKAVILLLLCPVSLTHKNPQRRKMTCGMCPVGYKDRLTDRKMFFVEIYPVCVISVAVLVAVV